MKKRSFLTMLVMLVMLVAAHSESLKITEEKLDKVVIEYTATNGSSLRMFKYTNRTAKETFSTLVKLYGFPTAIIGVDSDAIPFFKEQSYMCFTSRGYINFAVYNKANNNVQTYMFSTSILEE